uniref:Uncharacterized protein n=1 Tax=Aureoumbra lagunensis TaxID=44058 RepID=A0A6S8D862_9STRA
MKNVLTPTSYRNQEVIRKKREREHEVCTSSNSLLKYETELQRQRFSLNRETTCRKRSIEKEPNLLETEEALKRTRISCAPGELRMKNDISALEKSVLVRSGQVRIALLGTNAIMLNVAGDNFFVTIPQKYPFQAPIVHQFSSVRHKVIEVEETSSTSSSEDRLSPSFEDLKATDPDLIMTESCAIEKKCNLKPNLSLLEEWSAIYSLEDLANALYERSQVRGLFQFEVQKKPPILSSLVKSAIQKPPPSLPPPIMPAAFGFSSSHDDSIEDDDSLSSSPLPSSSFSSSKKSFFYTSSSSTQLPVTNFYHHQIPPTPPPTPHQATARMNMIL